MSARCRWWVKVRVEPPTQWVVVDAVTEEEARQQALLIEEPWVTGIVRVQATPPDERELHPLWESDNE